MAPRKLSSTDGERWRAAGVRINWQEASRLTRSTETEGRDLRHEHRQTGTEFTGRCWSRRRGVLAPGGTGPARENRQHRQNWLSPKPALSMTFPTRRARKGQGLPTGDTDTGLLSFARQRPHLERIIRFIPERV